MRDLCVLAVSGLLLSPSVLAAQDEGEDDTAFFDEGVDLEIEHHLQGLYPHPRIGVGDCWIIAGKHAPSSAV